MKHEIPFDRFQKSVLLSYNDGDHLVVTPDGVPNCGDGLLQFLLNEISEEGGCDSNAEAMRRLETAMSELRNVLSAFAAAKDPEDKPFTVIGVVEESGQIVCHHVMARSDLNAFTLAANLDGGLELVAALPGHVKEDRGISFPGEGVVDSQTVLEQPQVFDAIG